MEVPEAIEVSETAKVNETRYLRPGKSLLICLESTRSLYLIV